MSGHRASDEFFALTGVATDRAVWTPAIEIPHIFRQHSPQMALIEDEHVVQAFSAQRSHPALGDRVCLWRPERRANLGDAEGPHPSVEDRTITRHDRG